MMKRISNKIISNIHDSQLKTLTQSLILVDNKDNVTGVIDKKTAHLNEYIFSDNAQPHRAFSIFLFNEKNQLLLQKRSKIKITFPNYWTNTVCSHPLNVEDEKKGEQGNKLAAQRRLQFELNYSVEKIEDFMLIDKIVYRSASEDSQWGEYEVDHILFIRKQINKINPNPEEIDEFKWIDKENIHSFLQEKEKINEKITPWFKKILNYKLMNLWKDFDQGKLQEMSPNQYQNIKDL